MSILEAYCVELGRVVSIIEARSEYLNQDIPRQYDEYHFLCSTESCRSAGVKIIGACYKELPDEHKVSPYYRYSERNNIPDCSDCEFISKKLIKHENETVQEFKIRKSRAKLNDFIDEFILSPESPFVVVKKTSRPSPQEVSLKSREDSISESIGMNSLQRKIKTTMLARLVEYYRNAYSLFGDKDIWWQLPLKVDGYPINYLWEFFRRAEKAISERLSCIYIGEAEFKETASLYYFKFKSQVQNDQIPDGIPIYLTISKGVLNKYRYRRMFLAQIDKEKGANNQFKLYFMPNKDDLELKQLRTTDGNIITAYLFRGCSRLALNFTPFSQGFKLHFRCPNVKPKFTFLQE